jgi:hypothetical protein
VDGNINFSPVELSIFPVMLPEISVYRGRSVASASQRKATHTHRRRAAARGLVRVEVQAPRRDAGLIRALAERLRDRPERAEPIRSALASALTRQNVKTAFEIFGSELSDDAFAGIFDQPRQKAWRKVDL